MENKIKKKIMPKTKKKTKASSPAKARESKKSLKKSEIVENMKEGADRERKEMERIKTPEASEPAINGNSGESHLAKWTAPSFILTNGEVLIYRLCAVASPFMIVWSLFQGSYIVSITFLLVLIASVLHLVRKPEDMECLIDLEGIKMDDRTYTYDLVESFEVDEEAKVLKFKLRNAIFPLKEIYLEDQDPNYIRAVLEYFLPEEKQEAVILSRGKRESGGEAEMDEEMQSYLKRMEEKIERE